MSHKLLNHSYFLQRLPQGEASSFAFACGQKTGEIELWQQPTDFCPIDVRIEDELYPIGRQYRPTETNNDAVGHKMYNVAFVNGVEKTETEISATDAIADWNRDIERHETLRREYAFVASIQSELMGKIRKLKDEQGCAETTSVQDENALPAAAANGLPSSSRARMALRQAFQALDAPSNTPTSPIEKLEGELVYLDKRQAARKDEMAKLEGRVLTMQPANAELSGQILKFVSDILAFGHKVEASYLADILDACAERYCDNNAPKLRLAT